MAAIETGWERQRTTAHANQTTQWLDQHGPMEERLIRHRKSRFVFFARLPSSTDFPILLLNQQTNYNIGKDMRYSRNYNYTVSFFVLNVQMKMKKYLSKVAGLNEQKTK